MSNKKSLTNEKQDFQADFILALKKIENIYQETWQSLQELHQEKLTLIEKYKGKLDQAAIEKIKKNIKEDGAR